MSQTPDTIFADALQELCEESNLPAATVVGLMMYQIGMINEGARRKQEQIEALWLKPLSIPTGWRELRDGELREAGDAVYRVGLWGEVLPAWEGHRYLPREGHATVIRKIK